VRPRRSLRHEFLKEERCRYGSCHRLIDALPISATSEENISS
jgi:hypothetical protein